MYPVRIHFEHQPSPLEGWVAKEAGYPNVASAEVWVDMVKDRSDIRNARLVVLRNARAGE